MGAALGVAGSVTGADAQIKSQLALVEVNMLTIPQIFLPYAIMRDGRTLAEHAEENPNNLLGVGN